MTLLYHATTSKKAKAIQMVGFRIGEKTKRTTGYCGIDDWDCIRAEAYNESEGILEGIRSRERLDLPSRRKAIFFSPDTGIHAEESEAFKIGEDDWGRPQYDFGFGKGVLFTVDSRRIPCECAIGSNEESDEVFRMVFDNKRNEAKAQGKPVKNYYRNENHTKAEMVKQARHFWKRAKPYKEGMDNPYDSDPEIWCPCAIPRTAIVGKVGK